MFSRLPDTAGEADTLTFTFEGQLVSARSGDTVAAALMLAGVGPTRTTPVSGAPRAPYCMMGVCFECLMVINGQPDRQACLTEVAPGMTVGRQDGAGDLA